MARPRAFELVLPPVPPMSAGLSWARLLPEQAPLYRDLAAAAFAGVEGVVIPPVADLVVTTGQNPPWVLMQGRALIAFLRLATTEEDGTRVGYIATIGRDPAWKGRQLGDLLMHKALIELPSQGASTFCLDVAAKNAQALRLYERFGFRSIDEVRVWRRGVHASSKG
jgi:ribosomal protein S18 acetylase RimI-like enzyme